MTSSASDKVCKGCGERKPAHAFSKHPEIHDGRLNYCKPCVRVRVEGMPSRAREARAAWHRARRIELGLPVRQPADLERKRARKLLWWRAKHGLPLVVPPKRRRLSDEERKARHCEAQIRRQLRVKQQSPQWLSAADRAETEGMYHFCAVMRKITGQPWEVDHIVPLQGRTVSGLHVPWNLQPLLAPQNRVKSNRTS